MFRNLLLKVASTISGAALTLAAIVLFFNFPSYDITLLTSENDEHWNAIFLQAKEPFVNHNHLYQEGAHETKLSFRFVPAIILNILNIDNKLKGLVFQFFTLIIFYYLIILNFIKLFKNRVKAFIFSLPICFVISGHVYISDYRGIFDTLALDFLLISLYFRKSFIVIIPLLLAYFTDERSLIASPGIFIINIIQRDKFKEIKLIIYEYLYHANKYLFTSWALYLILRLFLIIKIGLVTDTVGVTLFLEQINKTLYTIYVGLEGFVVPLTLILYSLLKLRIYAFTCLLMSYFLLICWVAQSVYDISRSMSYALIFIIILLVLTNKIYSKKFVNKLIFGITFINIISVFSYPLVAQLYRMKFITQSI
jgi:hypothetical protein